MSSQSDNIMIKVSGKQLTLLYLNQTEFNQPNLIADKEGAENETVLPESERVLNCLSLEIRKSDI